MTFKSKKLIMLSGIMLFTSVGLAMEDTSQSRVAPNTIYLLVSPEQQQLMQQRELIEQRYPHIVCFIPRIASQDDFKIAKEYLRLLQLIDQLLYGACGAAGGQPLYPQLRILSEQALRKTHTYYIILSGESYRAFRAQKDEEELRKTYYDIHYRIAQNLLMFIMEKVLKSPYDAARTDLKSSLEWLEKMKTILQESPEHRKNLKIAMVSLENTAPGFRSLFHPNEMRTNPAHPQKISRRVAAYKTVNFHKQLLKEANRGPLGLHQNEALKNFDIYFKLKSREILTHSLELSAKPLSHQEYAEKIQALTEEHIALEKKGLQFHAFLLNSSHPPQEERLTVEVLTTLHRFFFKRYTLGSQSTLVLLENSIFMCIHANKVEDALIRLKALKNLLPEKVTQSPNFIALRASILALNGDFEEWRRLLTEKQEKTAAIKSQQKQTVAQQIKFQQEECQKQTEQKEAQKQEQAREKERINALKKAAALHHTQNNHETLQDFSDIGPSTEKEKYTITFPREKTKTRNPAVEPTAQETVSLTEHLTPSLQSPKNYTVSKAALATYRKIRDGNWHFPRKDLYNLFDKLGCIIDIEQGKGDHGTIHLPLTMTIHNAEGFVAILPEFIAKKEENTPLRPLTVPNWDEKWDGRVPPYMRNSILKALNYLGATGDAVHK